MLKGLNASDILSNTTQAQHFGQKQIVVINADAFSSKGDQLCKVYTCWGCLNSGTFPGFFQLSLGFLRQQNTDLIYNEMNHHWFFLRKFC